MSKVAWLGDILISKPFFKAVSSFLFPKVPGTREFWHLDDITSDSRINANDIEDPLQKELSTK